MAYVKINTTGSAARAINYGSHKLGNEREGLVAGGVNCDPETAKQQMEMTRCTWGKNDKVQGHVVIQSFKEGEITPSEANKLGLEMTKKLLAAKGLPDQEAVVFTHQDSVGHCIHNHIVINSVNPTTGQKINMHNELQRAREISDTLCRERGLSTISEPAKLRYTQSERGIIDRGQESWKDNIRTAVDAYAPVCRDFADFQRRLQGRGIGVELHGDKHVTYSMQVGGKLMKCRGNKLGADYDRGRINNLEQSYAKSAQYELHVNFESVQKCHPNIKLSDGLKAIKSAGEFVKDLSNKIDAESKKSASQICIDQAQWIVKTSGKAALMPVKLATKTIAQIGQIAGYVPVVGKPVQLLLGLPNALVKLIDNKPDIPTPKNKEDKKDNGYSILRRWNAEQNTLNTSEGSNDEQQQAKEPTPPQQAAEQQQFQKEQESRNFDGSLKATLKMALDLKGDHKTPLDAKNALADVQRELDYTLLSKCEQEGLRETRELQREMGGR